MKNGDVLTAASDQVQPCMPASGHSSPGELGSSSYAPADKQLAKSSIRIQILKALLQMQG
jgi:hypothetical protein